MAENAPLGADSIERSLGEPVVRARLAAGMARFGGRVFRAALSLVYPPQCIACSAATESAHALCPRCWSQTPFISDPVCLRLGTPFAHDFGAAMLSPAAIADPPRFDSARAVALHDGLARSLVAKLKYGERLDLARSMARLMVLAGGPLLRNADLIVPVPMHRWRLWSRRYNQAALLAAAVAEHAGKPVALDLLERIKRTPPQVGLSRTARRSNLAGAFRLKEGGEVMLLGRHVVVIDDVRTTGSTLNACAHILRKAGASRIDVLTFTLVA
ncbi:ComFC Predicted amidophosphoribosyltransferases [Rhabdaerophilaceae bacterium]